MFLCGTLKTIHQDVCSKDDMLEVSRYLQAVAIYQSHMVEILTRLASGPLLARWDACLAVSDLESDMKQSLRVQPIESTTYSSYENQVQRSDLPTGGRISFFLKAWEKIISDIWTLS